MLRDSFPISRKKCNNDLRVQYRLHKLKDDVGEVLVDGTFYEMELQKVIKSYYRGRVETIFRTLKKT